MYKDEIYWDEMSGDVIYWDEMSDYRSGQVIRYSQYVRPFTLHSAQYTIHNIYYSIHRLYTTYIVGIK